MPVSDNHDEPQARSAIHDAAVLGAAANTVLAGVPLAYATTGCVAVTAIAATAAMIIAFMARRPRSRRNIEQIQTRI
jgi:hypothetical protein